MEVLRTTSLANHMNIMHWDVVMGRCGTHVGIWTM